MTEIQCVTLSTGQTKELASKLAKASEPGDCITLTGDLGAGKTCFAQGFIEALTGEQNIQSPTFLLIKEYHFSASGGSRPLYHMDMYRIEHETELAELGLEEYVASGLCLIEWPEVANAYLPDDRLEVSIEILEENRRKITFFAKDDWQKRLNNIHLAP